MNSEIRNARPEDLEALVHIYASARAYMRRTGNPTQWAGGYPDEAQLARDIARGELYCIESAGRPAAAFALIAGDDPTYARIDGAWLSGAPYATLHRVASDGTLRGTFHLAVQFALGRFDHLRVDTHRDNRPMQNAVLREGFVYCGVICLGNGDPRLAYELVRT